MLELFGNRSRSFILSALRNYFTNEDKWRANGNEIGFDTSRCKNVPSLSTFSLSNLSNIDIYIAEWGEKIEKNFLHESLRGKDS